MTTPEQLAKLPKHAQETIRNLRRDLDRERQYAIALERELRGLAGDEPSRVSYGASLDPRNARRPLLGSAALYFNLDSGSPPRGRGHVVRANVQVNNGGVPFLDLNSDSTLLVAPASTNAVRIYSVERFLW